MLQRNDRMRFIPWASSQSAKERLQAEKRVLRQVCPRHTSKALKCSISDTSEQKHRRVDQVSQWRDHTGLQPPRAPSPLSTIGLPFSA